MKDLNLSIKLNVDTKDSKVNLASLKSEFTNFIQEIKKKLSQIEAFRALKRFFDA